MHVNCGQQNEQPVAVLVCSVELVMCAVTRTRHLSIVDGRHQPSFSTHSFSYVINNKQCVYSPLDVDRISSSVSAPHMDK